MSKKTLYLLGILLTIIIGTYFYWKICCGGTFEGDATNNNTSTENSISNDSDLNTTSTNATSNAFALNDAAGDFSFSANDNFNFNVGDYNYIKPVAASVDGGIDRLQAYLNSATNKQVNITGHYKSDETNNSAYPNLGLARANSVKNYFVSKGINSSQLNTLGKLDDGMIADGNIYRGPVMYGFSTKTDGAAKKDADDLAAMKTRINANPLILYFDTGEARINLSSEQRQQIAEISKYLDKKPDAKIIITGHTDDTGSRATNIRLGKERADFAKGYFVSNGIATAKIETDSKGPDQPLGTNATEEGRSKNRRTVVSLQ